VRLGGEWGFLLGDIDDTESALADFFQEFVASDDGAGLFFGGKRGGRGGMGSVVPGRRDRGLVPIWDWTFIGWFSHPTLRATPWLPGTTPVRSIREKMVIPLRKTG
jgi:hypothetical protein